jgi:uncharacterized protein YdeI (YjbR/CyaY-like superfamily)
VAYDDAVEEALCFGWVDSLVKTIDEEKYAQKFTPRRDWTKWSDSNRIRMKNLIEQGLMTKAGLGTLDAKVFDHAPRPKPVNAILLVPRFITDGLKANPPAWDNFNKLAPSYRKNYLRWIMDGKRQESRRRRLKEAVDLLKENKKLGMK